MVVAPGRVAGRRRRAPRRPPDRRRDLRSAPIGAERPQPCRAVHARRPLRDARGDDQLAGNRARRSQAPEGSLGMKDLAGRACLVTGAAGGIGRATAITLGARGARLVLTDIQAEPLEDTADAVRRAGGDVLETAAVDVTDNAAVHAFAERVHGAHGSLDAVLNVAGVSAWGPVERLRHEHWRRMVDVNLMGPINVIEA